MNGSSRWEDQAMSFINSITSIPNSTLWFVVGALCLSFAMYFTRVPAHGANDEK